jgi:hypothetical protein
MKVFIVVATRAAAAVSAAIRSKNLAHFEIKEDTWLIASDSTTRSLAEDLGIRGGQTGSGLVCLIEGYSGRLPKDAWEWLGLYEAKSE